MIQYHFSCNRTSILLAGASVLAAGSKLNADAALFRLCQRLSNYKALTEHLHRVVRDTFTGNPKVTQPVHDVKRDVTDIFITSCCSVFIARLLFRFQSGRRQN